MRSHCSVKFHGRNTKFSHETFYVRFSTQSITSYYLQSTLYSGLTRWCSVCALVLHRPSTTSLDLLLLDILSRSSMIYYNTRFTIIHASLSSCMICSLHFLWFGRASLCTHSSRSNLPKPKLFTFTIIFLINRMSYRLLLKSSHPIRNQFRLREKKITNILLMLMLVTLICCADWQKAACFERDFCVSCD